MKTIESLRDYLLDNHVDVYGALDISGLDFSDFEGDVFIGGMKVKGDLIQSEQKVKDNLFQESQEVQGDLYQDSQEVQGDLYQDNQKVKGNYHCSNVKVKGNIFANEPTKLLKEITTEELAEMGYKLKGENINETK